MGDVSGSVTTHIVEENRHLNNVCELEINTFRPERPLARFDVIQDLFVPDQSSSVSFRIILFRTESAPGDRLGAAWLWVSQSRLHVTTLTSFLAVFKALVRVGV